MMSKFLWGGAAAVGILIGTSAVAQSAQTSAPEQHRATRVATRADVQAHVSRLFSQVDTNRDGFVTKAELDALEAKRGDKASDRSERRAQRFDPGRIFVHLDTNKDGKVTRAEADAARTSHVVSTDGKPAEAHAVAFGGLFERADANKDGVITRPEFDAIAARASARHSGAHRGFGGRMFETSDLNKDGRVSLAEAQQSALQHFDQADLNRDGKVTREERLQSRKQLQGKHQPS